MGTPHLPACRVVLRRGAQRLPNCASYETNLIMIIVETTAIIFTEVAKKRRTAAVHGLTVKPDHGFAVRIHQTVFLCVFLHSFTC